MVAAAAAVAITVVALAEALPLTLVPSLVSTAAGLIVAIFTLLFANYFKSKSNNHIFLIQEYSAKVELLNSKKFT